MKSVDFYDYESFQEAERKVENIAFNDGQQGAFVRESLIEVKKGLHWYLPPEASILSLGLTVDNTGGVQNVVKSKRRTAEGKFQKVGTSPQGGGVLTLGSGVSSLNIEGYEGQSSYSTTELEQAKLEGENLYSSLIYVHQEKYLEQLDELGFDILLNPASGFTWVASPTPASGLTDAELANSLRNLIISQRASLNVAYHCDTLVMTPNLKIRCDSADYKSESGMSISDKIKQTLGVSVIGSHRLVGAGTGGTDVVLALNTNPNAIQIKIPKRLSITPTWRTGNNFNFMSSFRIGGVDSRSDQFSSGCG